MDVRCPRCAKPVYFAEQVMAVGHKFHKNCLKCMDCNKRLDSSNVSDHHNETFCRTCYGKKFGPKGYGFAGGASGLSMDCGGDNNNVPATAQAYAAPRLSSNKVTNNNHASSQFRSSYGSSDICPRCAKNVYVAELVQGAGRSYHQTCYTCSIESCRKQLNSNNVCDRGGEIYCKTCYGKYFGPKGVGYGVGAGALRMI